MYKRHLAGLAEVIGVMVQVGREGEEEVVVAAAAAVVVVAMMKGIVVEGIDPIRDIKETD